MSTVAQANGMRWRVESWAPGYGASREDPAELSRSSAALTLDVEQPESRWRPVDPPPPADFGPDWPSVLFVDGVRRIDAMAWIDDADADVSGSPDGSALALCASYAAGVVRCRPKGAQLVTAQVRRGLFTAARRATDVTTSAGRYEVVRTRDHDRGDPETELSQAVQDALNALEAAVAGAARANESTDERDLLVVDGPLRGRQHLPRVLGYIKTHRSEYLPAPLHRMVGGLRPGQRGPVFGLGTNWQRYAWYLKLPGSPAPWAGVVRVECPAELPAAEAVELADRSAPLLCRYASTEYKDSRAPQNLYPIAGLERELRHRLGDQALLYRAIRRASAAES